MKFLASLTVLLSVFSLNIAQTLKIGYTNIEYILTFMPEAKQMEQTLRNYEQKLTEQLSIKQSYAQGKLDTYLKMKEEKKLTAQQDEEMQKELLKLDEEIKKFAQASENDILLKREELLKPITDKLQKAIDEVAKEEGYTYILNSTNSSGVATILYGPEQHNVTEKIMKKLGITVPVAPEKSNNTNSNNPKQGTK
jgi:outer membrane protein